MGTLKSYITARTLPGTVVEFDTFSVYLGRKLFRVYDPVTRLEYRVEKLVCTCSADHERDWPPCNSSFLFGLVTHALNVRNNNNTSHKAEMCEPLTGETPLWGRLSPRQPRRFSLGYINTLSDGAQSANSLLAKSSRQRRLFFTMCFWIKFRAPRLDSVLLLTSSLRVELPILHTFEKNEMLYFFSYP